MAYYRRDFRYQQAFLLVTIYRRHGRSIYSWLLAHTIILVNRYKVHFDKAFVQTHAESDYNVKY